MSYGSFQNMYYANGTCPEPEVGQGATIIHWTDRTACTIVWVDSKKREVRVQRDHANRVDNRGMSDAQDYKYSPNPNGELYVFTLRKNGKWVAKGQGLKNGTRLVIGVRMEYYDFSF